MCQGGAPQHSSNVRHHLHQERRSAAIHQRHSAQGTRGRDSLATLGGGASAAQHWPHGIWSVGEKGSLQHLCDGAAAALAAAAPAGGVWRSTDRRHSIDGLGPQFHAVLCRSSASPHGSSSMTQQSVVGRDPLRRRISTGDSSSSWRQHAVAVAKDVVWARHGFGGAGGQPGDSTPWLAWRHLAKLHHALA